MNVPFVDLRAQYQSIKPQVSAAIDSVLERTSFILGPDVQQFEASFAEFTGRRYCIGVESGTAALKLALAALDIGAGDEVIVPANTYIASAIAISAAGATPVLVDADDAYLMDAALLEAAVTPRTKAIMPVHIFGLPVDMDPLLELADAHGLKIVEDAAEAIGTIYRGRPCGAFGDLSTFSFYPNKHVTTGEGGMILTDDDHLAERCRSLRNLCFQPGRRFVHEELGWNYRMSNLQAAVGVAQLEKLEQSIARKRRMGRLYRELLDGTPGIQLPLERTSFAENAYWVYGLVLTDEVDYDAAEAMRRLAKLNVQTRPFFWPMHEQPVLQRMGFFRDEAHPVAERLARRGFYIPSGMALGDAQINTVADAVKEMLA
jgi:perosamine synthetase